MSRHLTTEQVVCLSRMTQAATALSMSTIEHRMAVRAAHGQKLTVRQIAFAAGVHPSTIQRIIEQDRETVQKESTE